MHVAALPAPFRCVDELVGIVVDRRPTFVSLNNNHRNFKNELWLGDQCDRDYVAHMDLKEREHEESRPTNTSERRLR